MFERVLITGATGFLGRHLVEAFRRHGYAVVASARAKDDTVMADAWVLGDLETAAVQQAAVKDCAFVVNAAGRIIHGSPSTQERKQLFRTNSLMAVSLAKAAAQAGVQRFLHVSSTGVYGRQAPILCDESTACQPDGFYEQSKRAGEEQLLGTDRGSMQLVIARPSNVFGEFHPSNKLLTWMKTVKSGRAVLAGDPNQTSVNYVYVVDVAEAIVSLLKSPRVVGGEVFNINTACHMSEFYQSTAKAVGVDCHAYKVPKTGLVLLATLFDMVSRVTRRPLPLTRAKVAELTGQRVFSSQRLKDLCPEFPSVGLPDGLIRLARHYRNSGLL